MHDKYVFQVEGLNFGYPELSIFKDFNTKIEAGKRTVILGQNGCGKTTLLYLLSKNLKRGAGQIHLDDTDIDNISQREFAKKVAMVHQKNLIPHDITVEKLVSYGRTPHKSLVLTKLNDEDQAIMDDAMKVTGIYELRERPVTNLSSGQLQRVWIAMALAQHTDILFLDEPTTYLDVKYQLEILNLVERLNKERHITIVMILHDINQAIAYGDNIIALKKGSLIYEGDKDGLLDEKMLYEIYDTELKISHYENRPFVVTF
ncbi:MAG: ABC transporter ATP-binding protein [Eubacteriales bacterium]|nr:ABC transporter ATP-binding protein [Eubacteriales bacterium]